MLDPTAVLCSKCTLSEVLDAAEEAVHEALPDALTESHIKRFTNIVEQIKHKKSMSERGVKGYAEMKKKYAGKTAVAAPK